MSKKHLKLDAHPIRGNDNVWWYEDNGGIDIHVPPSAKHTSFKIPWRALRAALERKDRKPTEEEKD